MSSGRKKLIEVALPLEAINRESAREKSIRHGHPSTLHLWWARRPLAACRAVLFASIVDDPSSRPEEFPTEEDQQRERQRLFRIIEELVKWDNSNNETVLEAARAEIRKATNGNPLPVLDPFCGGGSIPLEAHRLGLEAHASDLNPVAVLITKALVEIPPEFAGRAPVNPESREKLAYGATWKGAQGLAEDVRYYGRWMRDEAFKRIGHLYPKAKLPNGGKATVIAWLWARTVKCPNPACGAQMPLVRSFTLSTKRGKEKHVEPIVDRAAKTVRFEVRSGSTAPEGTVGRRGARCVVCGTPVPLTHVRAEGQAGRMSAQLMAMVVAGERQRMYLSPNADHAAIARSAEPSWRPSGSTPERLTGGTCYGYGLTEWGDLFTPRQLVALTTLSERVAEAHKRIHADGTDHFYSGAVATYLGLGVSKSADYNSSLVVWSPSRDQAKSTFARQALPMVWDFAEVNPFAGAAGDLEVSLAGIAETLERLPTGQSGRTKQLDATAAADGVMDPLVCTDPPYYDNIGYADISDYFYVWLRRSLVNLYSDLFSTLLTPKEQELVATPYRFDGNRRRAEQFFEQGLGQAFKHLRKVQHTDYPLTLFYAFRQAESKASGDGAVVLTSTGWETMLRGLLTADLAVTGTWPMRTERGGRTVGIGTNALASSIVLVCRARPANAGLATRREFVATLRVELPEALRMLQHGNIAPVDLAQAAIGPGMGIFSRYVRIVEADGSTMTVRTALGLINQALDGEELSADWNPAADRRVTVWEVMQHLIKRLEEGGEDAAAGLLRRVGGLGEAARDLAYRLYTMCERKGWAQEALSYNALVVAWPEIARRVAGTPEAEAQQALEV